MENQIFTLYRKKIQCNSDSLNVYVNKFFSNYVHYVVLWHDPTCKIVRSSIYTLYRLYVEQSQTHRENLPCLPWTAATPTSLLLTSFVSLICKPRRRWLCRNVRAATARSPCSGSRDQTPWTGPACWVPSSHLQCVIASISPRTLASPRNSDHGTWQISVSSQISQQEFPGNQMTIHCFSKDLPVVRVDMNGCKIDVWGIRVSNKVCSKLRRPLFWINRQPFRALGTVEAFQANCEKMLIINRFYESRHFVYPVLWSRKLNKKTTRNDSKW